MSAGLLCPPDWGTDLGWTGKNSILCPRWRAPSCFERTNDVVRWSIVQHIDFTSEEFFRNPGEGVASLRAVGPVVATKFPIVGRVWVTTTYEAAARVLKDSTLF